MSKSFIFIIMITVAACIGQCPDYSAPGPFGTKYRIIAAIPSEDETMTNSRVYFPSINDTIPLAAVPCPIISFGHGFMTSTDNYFSYAQHFASWGYVCIVPTISNPIFNPNHNYRARLMITAARYIMNLNFNPTDIFYGKLDANNWAFVGHSMGGSISLLAGDRYVNFDDSIYHLHDTLRAIVSYASPQSNPATVPSRITTPYMILSGTEDNIAPWNEVRSAYWVGGTVPGAFAVIQGANHTYFTDYYGHYLTDGTATISRDEQRAIARRHTTAFLNRYMKGDTTHCNFLYTFGDSILRAPWMDSAEVRYIPLSIDNESTIPPDLEIAISPNPFNSSVCIFAPDGAKIEIYDVNGKKIITLATGTRIWTPENEIKSGVYFVRATTQEGQSTVKRVMLIR